MQFYQTSLMATILKIINTIWVLEEKFQRKVSSMLTMAMELNHQCCDHSEKHLSFQSVENPVKTGKSWSE